MIGRVLERRRAEPIRDPPRDLFDMMREAAVSDRVLVEQSATMLAAGHETTAVALFWSLYILAHLPAAQLRIAAEAGALDLGPAGAAQRAVAPAVHPRGRRRGAAALSAGFFDHPPGARAATTPPASRSRPAPSC